MPDEDEQAQYEPKRISVQLPRAVRERLIEKARVQSRSVSALAARYIRNMLDQEEGIL